MTERPPQPSCDEPTDGRGPRHAPGSATGWSWVSRVDIVAVLLFLLVLGRCAQELRIGGPDFFWHVKTGERMVNERRIVWRDNFSHTANGRVRVPRE